MKWYEKYDKLPSHKFKIDQSGNWLREVDPYKFNGEGLEPYQFTEDWKPIGYCLDECLCREINKRWNNIWVAILFERDNGDRVWFHYPTGIEWDNWIEEYSNESEG